MSNNLYIPLEEAIKVIKNWESITSNCDTIQESFDALADAIEIIPTIDPIATIDEMIEEIHKKAEHIDPDVDSKWEEELDKLHWKKIWLQELKQRLLSKK